MITYQQTGVNITTAEKFISQIKSRIQATFSPEVLSELGGFGALYDAKFKGIKNPVLVSSTDGVGTKLKVAFHMDKHDTIGEDLVNHCVNDIAVCGAKPLFFLDYLAMGKLIPRIAEEIMCGLIKACFENSCSLIGGEIAEMPGFYRENEYNIAGSIVGVIPKDKIIDRSKVRAGDILLGIPSTGLHTNGYSLARKVLFEHFDCEHFIDELGMSLGEALLLVHRSYLRVIHHIYHLSSVHGFAHITGGGIESNTSRVIPESLKLKINWQAWNRPSIFQLIQKLGSVPEEDMRRTFNLGIGLVIIVSKKGVDKLVQILSKLGEKVIIFGEIIKK